MSKEDSAQMSHLPFYGKAKIQRKDGLGGVALDPWDVIGLGREKSLPTIPVFALVKPNDVYTIGANQK